MKHPEISDVEMVCYLKIAFSQENSYRLQVTFSVLLFDVSKWKVSDYVP